MEDQFDFWSIVPDSVVSAVMDWGTLLSAVLISVLASCRAAAIIVAWRSIVKYSESKISRCTLVFAVDLDGIDSTHFAFPRDSSAIGKWTVRVYQAGFQHRRSATTI